MDFKLTDEQEYLRDTIRKFLTRECTRDVARALDETGAFPEALLNKLATIGLCGLNCAEEYGGGGRNTLGTILVIEELATLCPSSAKAFGRVALCGGKTLSELGNEDQKKRFLPDVAQGKILFTHASGEDSIVKATRQDDLFVLHGAKKFVPLAKQANFILTLAQTENGLTFFIVKATAAGVGITEIDQVGYRGASECNVSFENVRLTAEDVLGGERGLNRGAEQQVCLKAIEQIETTALEIGIARGAYEYAAQYAKERVQFGQAIAQFEVIQHFLVDLAIEIESARLLLLHAGWLADEGQAFALEAAMARTRAVEVARKSALQCLHILGGYGFMMEYDAQRYVRDALVGSEPIELLKSQVGSLLGIGL